MVEVLLYGKLADMAGQRKMTIKIDYTVETVADLIQYLKTAHPHFKQELARSIHLIAVNDEMASLQSPIAAQDCISFMPPVSGG
ncbi:MAG: MoaD/ThiS family protein [bacterium]